jgi:hypothetical protein
VFLERIENVVQIFRGTRSEKGSGTKYGIRSIDLHFALTLSHLFLQVEKLQHVDVVKRQYAVIIYGSDGGQHGGTVVMIRTDYGLALTQ